jgi:hypothetical protein
MYHIVAGLGFIPFIIGLIMLFKGSRISVEPLSMEESSPDNVDERKRILEMLAEGKIANAEADRLLSELSGENIGVKQLSAVRYRLVVDWPRWIAGFVLLLFSFWVFYISREYISAVAGDSVPFNLGLFSSHVLPWETSRPAFQSQAIPKVGNRIAISVIPCMMIPVAIAIMIFWFWMLIDCIRRPIEMFPRLFSSSSPGTGVKIFWLVLIFFFHIVPAIIYYFVVYRNPYTVMSNLQT